MIPLKEVKRQLVHLGVGFSFCMLYYLDLISEAFMVILTSAAVLLYYINKAYPINVLQPFLDTLERDSDRVHAPGKGAITLLIGIALSMFLFPKDVALAAIIILALGDSVAPLIGHYGIISHPLSRNKEKLLEGSIAGFIVGFAGAQFFVPMFEAFVAALFAMIFEAIEIRVWKKMDDNILMPLIAGGIIMFLRFI